MFPFKKWLKAAFVLGAYLAFGMQNGLASSPSPVALGAVHTVATFDASLSEFPEGLAIDKQGNIYAALTLTGNVWKMTAEGEQSILTHLDVGSSGGFLVGLAIDAMGNVYVCDDTFESGTHGIWKVERNGEAELFASLDPTGFPNAMAFDKDGNLFVTDSALGKIYKISSSGEVTVWLKDPLLAPITAFGANGMEFDRGDLWVANTDQGTIVRIKICEDGRPRATVFVQSPALVGADGIAFDERRGLYVAVDIQNTLVHISPDRRITTLVTASDGLDYPASTSFGQTPGQRRFLFWTNGGINFGTPSIQKVEVGIPGVTLP
jgi:sugar lactone lactonase YvrE